MLLLCGVLFVVTALALPAAWLTSRTNLIGSKYFTLLLVLPLAVPGYVMAYALLGLAGYKGMLSTMMGRTVMPLTGYWGALLALSLYNFPYMFLNLRSALMDLDPSLEEAARSLGDGRRAMLRRVIVPQLTPAYMAGAMLVALHVIADFGVVSLMGFDTFSLKLYVNLEYGDRANASRIGLLLLVFAAILITVEMWFLRGLRLDRVGGGAQRATRLVRLGWLQTPGVVLLGLIFIAGVVVPAATLIYWLSQIESMGSIMATVWDALSSSLLLGVLPAICATALAVPIAIMRARFPSRRSLIYERLPYIGYATPALAFALSLIFFARHLPWLYQSFGLLVYALTLHFMAEAVGPVRSSLYLATPRMEEASRSLGRGRFATFVRVTLPTLRNGLIVSMALVFLSCMKELPLTMLLSPPGTRTLATRVWSYSDDAQFHLAAPHALMILIFSCGFVALLLVSGRQKRKN